ncbi:hypothetical protein OHB54_35130 [Streptomyces sp. NBC_01007]|nr:hypothetical protein OHB54_35130 [Streptomyces sp. NBC_01007]
MPPPSGVEGLLGKDRMSLPRNRHILGWGAGNPEPSKGRYGFSERDSRVDLVRGVQRACGRHEMDGPPGSSGRL